MGNYFTWNLFYETVMFTISFISRHTELFAWLPVQIHDIEKSLNQTWNRSLFNQVHYFVERCRKVMTGQGKTTHIDS